MDEDNNKNKKLIRNIVIIIILAIGLIITTIIIYNSSKTSLIKKKLKKEKYTEISSNIFSKDINTNNINTNYTYNLDQKTFSKYISNQDSEKRETINLIYSNDKIDINYTYQDPNGCSLIQTGKYDKNNYECNILSKKGNCKSKCDIILKEAKAFFKEQQKIFK